MLMAVAAERSRNEKRARRRASRKCLGSTTAPTTTEEYRRQRRPSSGRPPLLSHGNELEELVGPLGEPVSDSGSVRRQLGGAVGPRRARAGSGEQTPRAGQAGHALPAVRPVASGPSRRAPPPPPRPPAQLRVRGTAPRSRRSGSRRS